MSATQKQYAFWRHDQFPFFLGGVVREMTVNGWVEIEGYGKGHMFNPVRIVPLKAGLVIKRKLDSLKKERAAHLKTMNENFEAELKKFTDSSHLTLPHQSVTF